MAQLFTVRMDYVEGLTSYLAKQKRERGRSEMHTLQRLMKYWISYAMAKVKRADREQIMLYLMGKTRLTQSLRPTTRKRVAKRNEILKNTLALAIVVKTNYRGQGRAARGDALYKLTEKYVSARGYAAGHHRAGFLPALKVLREPQNGKMPIYKRGLPGRIDFSNADNEMTVTVENWAKAIAEIAPNAFESATRELESNITNWLKADYVNGLKSVGLQTS